MACKDGRCKKNQRCSSCTKKCDGCGRSNRHCKCGRTERKERKCSRCNKRECCCYVSPYSNSNNNCRNGCNNECGCNECLHDVYCCPSGPSSGNCNDCNFAKINLEVTITGTNITFRIINTGSVSLCKEIRVSSTSTPAFSICNDFIAPGQDLIVTKPMNVPLIGTFDTSYAYARVVDNNWVRSRSVSTNYPVIPIAGYNLNMALNILPGNPAQVYFTVTNLAGFQPTANLVITLPYPSDGQINSGTVTFLGVYPEGSITPAGIVFNIGTLLPGTSRIYGFTYPYVSIPGTSVTWSAFASASNVSANPSGNFTSAVINY